MNGIDQKVVFLNSVEFLPEKRYFKSQQNSPFSTDFDKIRGDHWKCSYVDEAHEEKLFQILQCFLSASSSRIKCVEIKSFHDPDLLESKNYETGSFEIDSEFFLNNLEEIFFASCKICFPDNRNFAIINHFSDFYIVLSKDESHKKIIIPNLYSSIGYIKGKIIGAEYPNTQHMWLSGFFEKYETYFD